MMKHGRLATGISIALHGLLIAGIYTISASFPHRGRPVVIDFTVLDAGGGAPARPAKETKQAPSRGHPKVVERKPPAERRIETVKAPEPEPIHRPAMETKGPAPVSAPPNEVAPKAAANPAAARTGGAPSPGSGGQGRAAASQGSGPGSGGSSGQPGDAYRKENYAYIKTLIEKNIRYPVRARRMGWSGRVVVMFEVKGDGRVENVKVKESSGHEILDRNVIDTIRAVQPFPRPRDELVLVSIPITYRLD